VLLVDEVSCGEELDLSWLFHAGGDLSVEPEGALFQNGEARLRLRVHAPEPFRLRLSRRDDQELPYLVVATAARRSRALLVITLLPHRAGEPPVEPEVSVRGRRVELAWKGARHRLDVASRRWE
jgi:hypothetical protein